MHKFCSVAISKTLQNFPKVVLEMWSFVTEKAIMSSFVVKNNLATLLYFAEKSHLSMVCFVPVKYTTVNYFSTPHITTFVIL